MPKNLNSKNSEMEIIKQGREIRRRALRSDKKTISPEMYPILENLSGLGMTQRQIACMLGMSLLTFENRMAENPEIREILKRGKALAISKVASKAYEMAISGENTAMTIFFLKTQAGWKETQHIEHKVAPTEDMSTEEKLERIEQLRLQRLESTEDDKNVN